MMSKNEQNLKVMGMCLVALGVFGSRSAEARVQAAIQRVVVMADRAQISRQARVTCSGKETAVLFPHLPSTIDVRTIRADASGSAEVIGVSSRRKILEEHLDERVVELRAQLKKLNHQLRQGDMQADRHQARLDGLTAYEKYFSELLTEDMRASKPRTSTWEDMLEMLRNERTAIAQTYQQLASRQRDLQRRAEVIDDQLRALQPEKEAEAIEPLVAVACNGERRPLITLHYVTPQATWHPEYDVRFLAPKTDGLGSGKVELQVSAVVQQSTGEDWQQVTLVLSTAEPKLGAEAPYPAPLYVDGGPAGEEKVLVQATERRDELSGEGAAVSGRPRSAALDDKGTSVNLTIPRPVTIEADGRPYWMPVDVTATQGLAMLVTVPKLRPFVYAMAQLNNPAPYPLLDGTLHIHRGSSYVGDSRIQYTAPGEPLEVSLGIESDVEVERRPIRELDKRPGLLSSTQHLARAYVIELRNKASGPRRVDVRENIPVSTMEEITVELLEDETTEGYRLDDRRGILSWQVELDPGQKKQLRLAFVIHLPDDWKLQ